MRSVTDPTSSAEIARGFADPLIRALDTASVDEAESTTGSVGRGICADGGFKRNSGQSMLKPIEFIGYIRAYRIYKWESPLI